MTLTCLSTGSQQGNCYLLEYGDEVLILDCGMEDCVERLPERIRKRGGSYYLRRYINGERVGFYSTDIEKLIEFDRLMEKGIMPDKSELHKWNYTESQLNTILSDENEKWKWMKGYEQLYAISNCGSVVSFHKKKCGEKLSIKNKNGWYLSFRASDSCGKIKTIRVHIAVVEAFIGDIPDGYQVHHKDGNRQNNRVENLEILTPKQHSHETIKQNPHMLDGMIAYNKGRYTGKYPERVRNRGTKGKRFIKGKIQQYTLDGEFVAEYFNAMDASRKTGVCERNILQVANKEPFNSKGYIRKQAGGYIWKFESEVI